MARARDAAGGDGPEAGLHHPPGALDVGAAQGAVAGDVGVDHRPHADLPEGSQRLRHGRPGSLQPPAHHDLAFVHVHAGGHAIGAEAVQERGQPLRALGRGRADDHPVDAGLEIAGHVLGPAEPSAHLHGHVDPLPDLQHQVRVLRRALAGSVQVHHVEGLRALTLELPGHGGGVPGVLRGPVVVAAVQADAGAPEQVDGGKDDHGLSVGSQKFASILSPTGPDFSGWNCRPATRPRRTAAGKRSPYSVQART